MTASPVQMRTRRRLFSAIDFRKPPRQCSVHSDEPLGVGEALAQLGLLRLTQCRSQTTDGEPIFISAAMTGDAVFRSGPTVESAFANCGSAVAQVRGSYGPRLCENAKTLNRDRTSYSFEIVLGAQIASLFNFENEPKNIILVALRVFEFSHRLGQ
jgi:hypothetical protein